jgi:hypothetical protein
MKGAPEPLFAFLCFLLTVFQQAGRFPHRARSSSSQLLLCRTVQALPQIYPDDRDAFWPATQIRCRLRLGSSFG